MSYGKDFQGPSQRKGAFFLTRLNVSMPFESTIEERFLKVIDMDLRIVKWTDAEASRFSAQAEAIVQLLLEAKQSHVVLSKAEATFSTKLYK